MLVSRSTTSSPLNRRHPHLSTGGLWESSTEPTPRRGWRNGCRMSQSQSTTLQSPRTACGEERAGYRATDMPTMTKLVFFVFLCAAVVCFWFPLLILSYKNIIILYKMLVWKQGAAAEEQSIRSCVPEFAPFDLHQPIVSLQRTIQKSKVILKIWVEWKLKTLLLLSKNGKALYC